MVWLPVAAEHRLWRPLRYRSRQKCRAESRSFLNGVEDPIGTIIDQLKEVHKVKNTFDLGNGIVFENHPDAISDTAEDVVDRNIPSTPHPHSIVAKSTSNSDEPISTGFCNI
nr:uncharacterized protein CTRU02_12742 [Colletotrichum truncatum]KAF6784213.1 hypothetical protein CTRU02_12742 [Colletotrichum truncatum]